MKLATLFSGIGAPEQGAKRVYGDNIELVFACEYDKFARQSFEANYNIDPLHFHKDVRELNGTQYRGKVDILVGGSPCQAFSIAGLRNGTNDERGQLIYQYIRIVNEVKAPIIIYENVKGMLSIDGGRTIKEFVQALRDIGYFCHYEVINTKDYGVPQNRERIFLVGFLDHEVYHRFQFAPKQKLEKRLKDILEDKVDDKYYLSDKIILGFLAKNKRYELEKKSKGFTFAPSNIEKASSCINARYNKSGASDIYIDVVGLLDCKGTDQIRRVYGTNGIAATLTTMQGGNQEPKIMDDQGRKRKKENPILLDFCPTLRAQSHGNEPKCVINRIRKLTPRECLRLQDFPDDFVQFVSNSQMYKQAGNSMSVNVLEMIFRQIEKALHGKTGNLFRETE